MCVSLTPLFCNYWITQFQYSCNTLFFPFCREVYLLRWTDTCCFTEAIQERKEDVFNYEQPFWFCVSANKILNSNVKININAQEKCIHHMTWLRIYTKPFWLTDHMKCMFQIKCLLIPLFSDRGMNYIVGKDWQDLFDVVIVQADKPGFFNDRRK